MKHQQNQVSEKGITLLSLCEQVFSHPLSGDTTIKVIYESYII